MKRFDLIVLFILFYFGWFGSVFLAKTNFHELSFLFPFFMVGFLIYKKSLSLKKIIFALAIAGVGSIFDFLMLHLGFIKMQTSTFFFLPAWLISIWLLFSFSMIQLGRSLNISLGIAFILGIFMGPLSYKSGELFEVLTFTSSMTFIIYGIFWSVFFPILLHFSKRIS